ncbi:bifunctional peptidase and arginyl-hydroxylase JMJD5-like [Mercenaria mercenaria]|uniref:bifunctional peptidase and arginyl-hydroxylase JMJD5-like n=1 Tax=Mercenaria mercenaria TaxID=6596 RepID=UPI00234E7725|nr:bifunctional peptidase and arginyl-hydroxylase JMJD5-like [Mercenaria mercenaria]
MKKQLKVVIVLSLLVSLSIVVVGQFKKLGSHKPPSKGATILAGKFPPPTVFYSHFIEKGQPLLMKGVLNETGYTAFVKWTDKYLGTKYGSEIVEIERGKKEDRDGKAIELTLSKYLEIYKSSDLYMVHTVPDSMKDEVLVPYSLQCGGFQDNLQDAVLWFSGGSTKSVLHYDTVDNINCLLDGEKKLVLIDKRYKNMVEEHGWVEDGAYSQVDVDAVDPGKFPGVYNAAWFQINMQKGDCVYIPYKWYHHVYSPPGRNLAVNLWFSHLWWFNQTDCKDYTSKESKPLSEFSMASPNMQLRSEFLSRFDGHSGVSQKSFIMNCGCTSDQDALKLWEMLNKNKDRKLTWEEFYSFDMDEAVMKVPQCFNVDIDEEEEESVEDKMQEEIKVDIGKDETKDENVESSSSEPVDNLGESLGSVESQDKDIKDIEKNNRW